MGEGVSQGHSDAIRRVEGVKDAIQYTIPKPDALERVRAGENPELTTREMHRRVCYVVEEDGYDKDKISLAIRTMPNYFVDYDTEVNFVRQDDMDDMKKEMSHAGFVMRSGETGDGHKELIEFSLKLESNPEFTGSVLTAYARATHRLNQEGVIGAKTVFDIAPAYLSIRTPEEMRKDLL